MTSSDGILPTRSQALRQLCDADWLAPRWSQRGLVDYLLKFNADPLADFRPEGYWAHRVEPTDSLGEPALPSPEAGSWAAQEVEPFLVRLDAVERALSRRELVRSFMGFSTCRICACRNGTREFFIEGWKWPEGLRHYIADHRVRPSGDFLDLIARLDNRLAAKRRAS